MKTKSIILSLCILLVIVILISPLLLGSVWRMNLYAFERPFKNGLLYYSVITLFLALIASVPFGSAKIAISFRHRGFLDLDNVSWLKTIGFLSILVGLLNPVSSVMESVGFNDATAIRVAIEALMLDSTALFLISAFTFLYAEFTRKAIEVKQYNDNIM